MQALRQCMQKRTDQHSRSQQCTARRVPWLYWQQIATSAAASHLNFGSGPSQLPAGIAEVLLHLLHIHTNLSAQHKPTGKKGKVYVFGNHTGRWATANMIN